MKKHIGSSFQSFLEEKGIKDEVELRAQKEILAEQNPRRYGAPSDELLGPRLVHGDQPHRRLPAARIQATRA